MAKRQTATTTAVVLMTIPVTDNAIEARPSRLARGTFETALLFARTARTYKNSKTDQAYVYIVSFALRRAYTTVQYIIKQENDLTLTNL